MNNTRLFRVREMVIIACLVSLIVALSLLLRATIPLNANSALVVLSGVSLGPIPGLIIGVLSRVVLNFYLGHGPWSLWQMAGWGLVGALSGIAFNKKGGPKRHERVFHIFSAPILSVGFFLGLAYISYLLLPLGEESFLGWRIYIFGGIGLIAGMILQKKRLPIDRLSLSFFTFFVIFTIYGGLLNLSSLFTMTAAAGQPISIETLRALYISGIPYDLGHAGSATAVTFLTGPYIIRILERVKRKYGLFGGE